VNLHAAGLDIGSVELWACVPEDRDAEPVRPFGTLTPDLDGLADWLTACRMETVALASTGGYWLPVYALLEARGFRVSLVNAHHRKPVPGRKRDVTDCPGMQDLHTGGLLSGSCRPAAEMGAVQAYWRHRATWLEQRAAPIQHRQKALHRMHVQLTQVRTDMTGTPGLAISRAIVAGARAPVQLARCRDPRCAHSTAESAKALTGHERAESVFALKPALALDDIYTLQVREGEAENERQFQASTPGWADQLPPLDREPTAASPSLLPQLTGVD
jgi:transposase